MRAMVVMFTKTDYKHRMVVMVTETDCKHGSYGD